jgi:hypothetical protein
MEHSYTGDHLKREEGQKTRCSEQPVERAEEHRLRRMTQQQANVLFIVIAMRRKKLVFDSYFRVGMAVLDVVPMFSPGRSMWRVRFTALCALYRVSTFSMLSLIITSPSLALYRQGRVYTHSVHLR